MDTKFSVAELVPHSGNMSLLDEIVDYGENWLKASVQVSRDSMFLEEQGVPASVGIEYLAQAIAAYSGVQERKGGGKPKLGFLLGVRKYLSSTDYYTFSLKCRLKMDLMYFNVS